MSVKLKPFKTFDEQVDRLKDVHKLTIKESDRGNVIFALETINYYSLRGYGLCFETKKPRKNLHKYKRNTTINDIKYIYNFDSKLKSEVLRIIGLIENNLKTIFAYYFVKNHKLDPECYMLPQNYYKGNDAIEIFKKIKKQKIKYVNGVPCPRDKNDLVIKNHIQKYNAQFPMWVIIQYASMDNLLKLYGCMYFSDKDTIAGLFNTNRNDFDNKLYVLKQVRNICAHFNRLIFRDFPEISSYKSNKLFYVLLLMRDWLRDKNEWNIFYKYICLLFGRLKKRFKNIRLSNLGFPKKWKKILK